MSYLFGILAFAAGAVVAVRRGWARRQHRAAELLTAFRTALIATFAAFGFALWTWREADRWQRIASALLLVLLLLGMFQFAPAPLDRLNHQRLFPNDHRNGFPPA